MRPHVGLSGLPGIPGESKQPRARSQEASFLQSYLSLSLAGLSFSPSLLLPLPSLFGVLQHLLCPTPTPVQMFALNPETDSYPLLFLVLVCIFLDPIKPGRSLSSCLPLVRCTHPWLIPLRTLSSKAALTPSSVL